MNSVLKNSASNNILAIIPARGGSKGIPRKNIKDLCGKPLIAYSVEAALKSKWINRVIVSTDDMEIAAVARKYGAETPFLRPPVLALDRSGLGEVTEHAHRELQKENYVPDITIILFPTHPFRNPGLIDFLINKGIDGHSFIITAKSITHTNMSIFAQNGRNRIYPLLKNKRHEGDPIERVYYRSTGLFIGLNNHCPDNNFVYVVKNPISLIDIDTPKDFYLAEEVVKNGLFDFDGVLPG